jgi:hypothetical protein
MKACQESDPIVGSADFRLDARDIGRMRIFCAWSGRKIYLRSVGERFLDGLSFTTCSSASKKGTQDGTPG